MAAYPAGDEGGVCSITGMALARALPLPMHSISGAWKEYALLPDPAVHRQRNLVERFLYRIKQFRRIATRFDKLARNFFAAVLIAATRLWLSAYGATP